MLYDVMLDTIILKKDNTMLRCLGYVLN